MFFSGISIQHKDNAKQRFFVDMGVLDYALVISAVIMWAVFGFCTLKAVKEMANSWGGKREGAGRRPGAADGTERKMRSLRASDGEWDAIKIFAKYIKDNPEKMPEILAALK